MRPPQGGSHLPGSPGEQCHRERDHEELSVLEDLTETELDIDPQELGLDRHHVDNVDDDQCGVCGYEEAQYRPPWPLTQTEGCRAAQPCLQLGRSLDARRAMLAVSCSGDAGCIFFSGSA